MSVKEMFSGEQIQEVTEIFKLFDNNGDGKLTAKEFGIAVKSFGQNPTHNEINCLINEVDTDGSREVGLVDFIWIMDRKMNEAESEEEVRDAFCIFDQDGDGYINATELREAMKNLGENVSKKEIQDMIAEVDTNGCGLICYHDFITFMTSKH